MSIKDASPFKDVMPTMERPLDMYTSPPKSADYYTAKKSSFFGGGLGLISRLAGTHLLSFLVLRWKMLPKTAFGLSRKLSNNKLPPNVQKNGLIKSFVSVRRCALLQTVVL